MNKITPGNWNYDELLSAVVVLDRPNHRLHTIADFGKVTNFNPTDAQAIAAVPDLISALQLLLVDFVYLRNKCMSLGCNWTLKNESTYQYNFAKNVLERVGIEE